LKTPKSADEGVETLEESLTLGTERKLQAIMKEYLAEKDVNVRSSLIVLRFI